METETLLKPSTQLQDVVKLHVQVCPDVTAEEIVEIERNRGNTILPSSVEAILNELQKNRSYSLEDVHNLYKKWFHLRDTNRIDVVLAVALSRRMEGTPLWLIMVSNSGDMKSEQVNALDDNEATTKMVHKFTDKTLVNGYKDKEEYPDLAPVLNGKVMIISDMAEILQLHPTIKGEVWAQLRNLFDGYAGVQTGMGTDVRYRDLRVTLIGCSTPAIDDQILIHQSLGTRELIYRPKSYVNVNDLMNKVWENEETELQMREELKVVCQGYLKHRNIMEIEIPEYVEKEIKRLAKWLCDMRASAPIDSYSGELRGDVHPERPTRILKQLKRLYICLKSLDVDYKDDTALEILREVVESSADQTRLKVITLLDKNDSLTTSQVADQLKIGKKTAKTELCILWNLGRITRTVEETTNSYGQTYITKEEWSAVTKYQTE